MLRNKIAVVTGANRGIGLAIARTFAAQGARVLACTRQVSDEALADAAAALQSIGLELAAGKCSLPATSTGKARGR